MTSNPFLHELKSLDPELDVMEAPGDCWAYGYDNSRRHALPDYVAFPTHESQVVSIVQLCNRYRIPLTTRGRGTGTTGATVPIHGGLVLSFERMNRILSVDPANRLMVVQPGVTNQQVQDVAGTHGFFWPPDPTSSAVCTIGGNLALNAAGPRAVKYGTPRENTLGLRAVTGSGELLRCGVSTSKGVVGYDLTRLIIGSEGTLAIITEATLKLTPLAETKRTLKAIYNNIRSAATAVSDIMALSVTPCALELMDGSALKIVRDYSSHSLPDNASALLMIEADGPIASIDHIVNAIKEAASNSGLLEITVASTQEEVKALWATRKALSPCLRKIAPKKINEDVVVPVSHIPDLIDNLQKLSERYGIPIVNFGHAGNGNIHVNLLLDPAPPGAVENAYDCLKKVFELVLQLGGTLSGEHGVGLEKRDFIALEVEPNALKLMQAIRRQFDPNEILHRDKTLPG